MKGLGPTKAKSLMVCPGAVLVLKGHKVRAVFQPGWIREPRAVRMPPGETKIQVATPVMGDSSHVKA